MTQKSCGGPLKRFFFSHAESQAVKQHRDVPSLEGDETITVVILPVSMKLTEGLFTRVHWQLNIYYVAVYYHSYAHLL